MGAEDLSSLATTALKPTWSRSISATIIMSGSWVFFFLMATISFDIVAILMGGEINYLNNNFFLIFIVPIILLITYSTLVPLLMGQRKYAYNIIYEKNYHLKDIFYYFGFFNISRKAWKLNINMLFRKAFVNVLCFSPGSICLYLLLKTEVFKVSKNSYDYYIYFFLIIILLIISYFLSSFINTRYHLVYFLFLLNPHNSNTNIFKLSKKIARDNKVNIIKQNFKKIPYLLLSLLILPILFTYPKMLVDSTLYSKKLVEEFQQKNIFST